MTAKSIAAKSKPILLAYGIKKAALFGSQACGFLIQTDGKMGLFTMVGLKLDLEKALSKKIDLVEYGMLKSAVAKRAMKEQLAII